MSTMHSGRNDTGKRPETTVVSKVQPTVEQLQIARLLMSPDTEKKISESDIDKVIEVTGQPREVAIATLENCNYDAMEAIDHLLNEADKQTQWQEAGKRKPRKQATTSTVTESNSERRDRSKSQQNGDVEPSRQRGGDASRGRKNQPPRFRNAKGGGGGDAKGEDEGESGDRRRPRRNQGGSSNRGGRRRGGGGDRGRGRRGNRESADSLKHASSSQMPISVWSSDNATEQGSAGLENIGTWAETAAATEKHTDITEIAHLTSTDDLDDEWTGDLNKLEFTQSHMNTDVTNGHGFDHSNAIQVNVQDILNSVGSSSDMPVSSSTDDFNDPSRLATDSYTTSQQSDAVANYLLTETIKNAVGIGKAPVSEPAKSPVPAYNAQQAAEDIKNIVGIGKVSVQPNIQAPKMKFTRSKLPPPSKIPAAPVQMPRTYNSQTGGVQFGGIDFGSHSYSSQATTVETTVVSAATASSSDVLSYTTLESTSASLVSADAQPEAVEARTEADPQSSLPDPQLTLGTPTRPSEDSSAVQSSATSSEALSSSFPQQQYSTQSYSVTQPPQNYPNVSLPDTLQQKPNFASVYGSNFSEKSDISQPQPAFQSNFQSSSTDGSLYNSGSAASPLRHKHTSPSTSQHQTSQYNQFSTQANATYEPPTTQPREQYNPELSEEFSQLGVKSQDTSSTTFETSSSSPQTSLTDTVSQASSAASTTPLSSAAPTTPQYSRPNLQPASTLSASLPSASTASQQATASSTSQTQSKPQAAGIPGNLPIFPSHLMPGHGLPLMPMMGMPGDYDLQLRLMNSMGAGPADGASKGLARGDTVQSPPQQASNSTAAANLNSHGAATSIAPQSQQNTHPYMQGMPGMPFNPAALYYNTLGLYPMFGLQAMTQASHSTASVPGLRGNASYGTQGYGDYDQAASGQDFSKYGAASQQQNKQHMSGTVGTDTSNFNSTYGKSHHGYDNKASSSGAAGVGFHTNTPPPFNYLQGMSSAGSGQGSFPPYVPMMHPPPAGQQGLVHPHMQQQDGSTSGRMNSQSSGASQSKPQNSKYNFWN